MKIGIIGAGSIGYNIAKKLAPNHTIKIAASKQSEELRKKAEDIGVTAVNIREAVKDVEVLITSIPLKAIPDLPTDLFDAVPEDIIIADTSNYYPLRDGHIEELDKGKVESVWVSEHFGRPVIKAFNNLMTHTLVYGGKPEGEEGRLAISVAGDSSKSKEIIGALINEIGFDVVDGGKIAESWRQQPGTPGYCSELTCEELKEALATANKETAAKNRDQVIKLFMEKGDQLTHQDMLSLNRLGNKTNKKI